MQTKTEKIKQALADNDFRKALSIASRFFDKSADTRLFKQAQSAINNPAFYKQIGKDPDKIVAAALAVIQRRFA